MDFTIYEFYDNTKPSLSWSIILLGFITSILILLFLVLFSYLFFIKNSRETIYVKHLHYRSPCVPCAQLILCFVNTFLIVKTTYTIISFFVVQFLTYMSTLLVAYKIFRFFQLKSDNNISQPPNEFEARSDIFTINTQKSFSKRNSKSSTQNSTANDSSKREKPTSENDTYVSTSSNLHLIS